MLAGVFHARDIETFKPSKMKTAERVLPNSKNGTIKRNQR